MGIALDKLGQGRCAEIAAGCFSASTINGAEMPGLCPFHEDKKPSFSYNIAKDVYSCQACGVSGDLVSLWCHANGYATDSKDGFKAFCQTYDIQLASGASGEPGEPKPPSLPPTPPVGGSDTSGHEPDPLDASFDQFPPLPQSWQDMLKTRRGWTAATIEQLDLRLQTHYRPKDGGDLKKLREPERIAIPVRDADGHVRNIRLYKPGQLRDGESKIISWAKGYGSARLFPATPHPEQSPVVLVEGESDTICAISQGINAITLTSKPKKWTRAIAKEFENRDVILALDADQVGQNYVNVVVPYLGKVVRSLRIIEWPEYMGLEVDGTWPEKGGQDLTDFFVTHKKTMDDWWALVADAQPVDVLRHKSSTAIEFFELGVSGRASFKSRLLAESIMERFDVLYDPGSGLFYRWNDRFWQLFHEEHLKSLAIRMLGIESGKSRVEDAVYQVKNLSTLPDGRDVNDNKGLVCVKNGMLDLDTWKLLPHDRDFFATFELNVTWDPESDRKCDRWLKYLGETVQTRDVIMQVQEFFGYCLTKDVIHAKSMFLVGPGSDGKSVMLKILRDMVGPENTSSVSFGELENQFLRASLYQKAVNFSTETASLSLESEYFKKISAGDPINAAFKHKDSFEFVPFCKLVFSANRLPRVVDNSDGFYRRVMPIQFKRQFREGDPDTDPRLYDKLKEELSEIFTWALVGLKRLWQQNRFTDCQETQEQLLGYRRLNNPVLCFLDDACQLGDQYETPKDDLYSYYREYCLKNGYKSFARENFFRELYAAKDNLQLIRPRIDGKRMYVIKGIHLETDSADAT